ncbi:MAG: helix-turn-helix domain-containing protein [Syntrophorhabdus sp.]|nr:helix-turn-helix domain-containing protein [Pseudomonadota bacterium]
MTPQDLKTWRYKTGFSQAGLAKTLGVTVMTVSRWERGTREIPPFLYLALGYLELKGGELLEKGKRKRKRKGGGTLEEDR